MLKLNIRCVPSGPTFDTGVADVEVGLQRRQTGFGVLERRVGHPDVAATPAGAAGVEQRQHVVPTPDVPHVDRYAPAEAHAPVLGAAHEQNVAPAAAARSEEFGVAMLRGGDGEGWGGEGGGRGGEGEGGGGLLAACGENGVRLGTALVWLVWFAYIM